jgi:hypothetical protein
LLFFIAAVMFGVVGAVLGGVLGAIVGFVLPLAYAWQARRLRDRGSRSRF